jgi:hypothetical protein
MESSNEIDEIKIILLQTIEVLPSSQIKLSDEMMGNILSILVQGIEERCPDVKLNICKCIIANSGWLRKGYCAQEFDFLKHRVREATQHRQARIRSISFEALYAIKTDPEQFMKENEYYCASLCVDDSPNVRAAVGRRLIEIAEAVPAGSYYMVSISRMEPSIHSVTVHGEWMIEKACSTLLRKDDDWLDTNPNRMVALTVLPHVISFVGCGQLSHVIQTCIKYAHQLADATSLLPVCLSTEEIMDVLTEQCWPEMDKQNWQNIIGALKIIKSLVGEPNRHTGGAALTKIADFCDACSYWPQLVQDVVRVIDAIGDRHCFENRLIEILITCKINIHTCDDETMIFRLIHKIGGDKAYDGIMETLIVKAPMTDVERGRLRELVSNCSISAIQKVLPTVLTPILVELADPAAGGLDTIDRRLDSLDMLNTLIERHVFEGRCGFLESLIDAVLVENIKWRPGETNNRLRKVAVYVWISTMRIGDIGAKKCMENLEIISSVINDIWSPDSRILGIKLIKEANRSIDDIASHPSIVDAILERLDDDHQEIRTETMETLMMCYKSLDKVSRDKAQRLVSCLTQSEVETSLANALLVDLE